jgi:4'-phosphopantetheinyl transferase
MFWLSQTESDVLSGADWLSSKEQAVLSGLRFAKRRQDWLLGRWTAKQCLCGYLQLSPEIPVLKTLEIVAAPDGAPEPFQDGHHLPLSLSLSHCRDVGLAAVAIQEAAVGCDVEWISGSILEFIGDYLTPSEIALISGSPAGRQAATATLIWCAKESALKSLREGLRRDTRSIEVSLEHPRHVSDWESFVVTCTKTDSEFHGWWRGDRGYVWALASRIESSPDADLRADKGAK